MARKQEEAAAAKAKKQKTILIIGGVLLLAVGVFQGQKLMKSGGTPAAVPAEATAAAGATEGTDGAMVATGTTPAGTNVVVTASNTGAVVAGVALPRKSVLPVATSQLASFTLFEVKDPFIQQTSSGADSSTTPTTAESDPSGTGTGTNGSTSTSGGDPGSSSGFPDSASAPIPEPIVYATINVDGKPQQVTLKQTFPVKEPLFVLRSLKAKQAKIGVAGGSFDDGQTVALPKGKKVTLVNTATGVRYVLKLVYTGSSPEVIEGFTTTGGGQPAAGANPGDTSATTTTSK